MSVQVRAIIFDCDGVLVDSERLAQQVLIDLLAEYSISLTHDECQSRFMGKTIDGVVDVIRAMHGDTLAALVASDLTPRTIVAFERDLQPVRGIRDVLAWLTLPRAVATSSSPERVATSLRVTGLAPFFDPHVYTASMVAHPKPAPDLYLLAASRLNVPPQDCIVIEDSPTGVRAGVAAGMHVIGFIGGTHTNEAMGEQLRQAGAAAIVPDALRLRDHLARIVPA